MLGGTGRRPATAPVDYTLGHALQEAEQAQPYLRSRKEKSQWQLTQRDNKWVRRRSRASFLKGVRVRACMCVLASQSHMCQRARARARRTLQTKLTRIRHGPPAVFHAPLSHGSLLRQPRTAQHAQQPAGPQPDEPEQPELQLLEQRARPEAPPAALQPRKAPPSTMPCHEHYVDVPPWPPRRCESYAITRQRRQRAIDEVRARMEGVRDCPLAAHT